MHEDQRWSGPMRAELGCEPRRPPLAEGAAVPPLLERVEAQHAHALQLNRIVDEALLALAIGKRAQQVLAAVMIANQRIDREWTSAERIGENGRAHVRTPVNNAHLV